MDLGYLDSITLYWLNLYWLNLYWLNLYWPNLRWLELRGLSTRIESRDCASFKPRVDNPRPRR
jgi:hypothetical protein